MVFAIVSIFVIVNVNVGAIVIVVIIYYSLLSCIDKKY